MVSLICAITITVNAGGIPFLVKADVAGVLLKEGQTKYLVDFSKDLANKEKYALAGNPKDYSSVLVNKTDCVK